MDSHDFLGLFAFLLVISSCATGTPTSSDYIYEFTKSVYDSLRGNKGNIFTSSLSIQIVLAMLQNGAQGNTLQQIQQGANLPNSKDTVNQEMVTLKHTLANLIQKGIELNIANKIFVFKNKKIKNKFQKTLIQFYNASVSQVDFKNGRKAANEINQWAAQNTHGRIKQVTKADDFDKKTQAVLVNAIYFKASWKHEFESWLNKVDNFFVTPKEIRQTTFMLFYDKQLVAQNNSELDSWILELPYVGEKLSMILIVPHQIEGWKQAEDKLSTMDLKKIVFDFPGITYSVSLKLPKFKIKNKIDLVPVLEKHGMGDLFKEGVPDLSSMAKTIYISKASQDSFLSVNEKGSEAAVTTNAVAAGPGSALDVAPQKIMITVDRPFIFTIVMKNPAIPLFIGRINEP